MKRLLFLPLIFLAMTAYAGTPLYPTKVGRALSDMLNPSGKFTTLRFSDGTTQTTAGGDLSQVTGILAVTKGGTGTNTATLDTFAHTGTSTFPSGVWGSTGSLGVGTTTPATELHVVGTVTATSLAAHESGTITMNGNVKLNGNYLSGDGDNEGVSVGADGLVRMSKLGTNSASLVVSGRIKILPSVNGNQTNYLCFDSVDEVIAYADSSFQQFGFGVSTNYGKQFLLVNSDSGGGAFVGNDYAHPVQSNPTLFIHSNTTANVATNQWVSLSHNGSNGQIATGAGGLVLSTASGNLGIGGATFGTGTAMLAIANSTVTGMAAISNQGQIFCEGGELKAMDGSGNITPFSPHSELDNLVTNLADPLPHTYVSTNSYLGKKKIVNMAVLIEEIEKLSGKTLVTYEDVPLRDWTADQDAFRVQRDLERLKKEAEIDEINTQIAELDNQLSVAEEEKKEGLKISKESLQKQKAEQNKTMPDEYILQHPPKWMIDRGVTLDL